MKIEDINYVSDPVPVYCKGLDKAKTLEELREHLDAFNCIAQDAVAQCPQNEVEFAAFRKGLLGERKGKFSGQDWMSRYGHILVPDLMMEVGLIASHFGAPWGCAFIQMREHGALTISAAGVAYIVRQQNLQSKGEAA